MFCYGNIIWRPIYLRLLRLYCLFNMDFIIHAHQQRDATTPRVVSRLLTVVYLRGTLLLKFETRHPIGWN